MLQAMVTMMLLETIKTCTTNTLCRENGRHIFQEALQYIRCSPETLGKLGSGPELLLSLASDKLAQERGSRSNLCLNQFHSMGESKERSAGGEGRSQRLRKVQCKGQTQVAFLFSSPHTLVLHADSTQTNIISNKTKWTEEFLCLPVSRFRGNPFLSWNFWIPEHLDVQGLWWLNICGKMPSDFHYFKYFFKRIYPFHHQSCLYPLSSQTKSPQLWMRSWMSLNSNYSGRVYDWTLSKLMLWVGNHWNSLREIKRKRDT